MDKINKLLEIFKSLTPEEREMFDRGRKLILFEEAQLKIYKQRIVLASALVELVDENSKPYISAEWLKKNVLGID